MTVWQMFHIHGRPLFWFLVGTFFTIVCWAGWLWANHIGHRTDSGHDIEYLLGDEDDPHERSPRASMTAADPNARDAAAVLSFWFGDPDTIGARSAALRARWFSAGPAFDSEVRERFLGLYRNAAAGGLNAWRETPPGALALCIVLDQFPRNMFRGLAQSFATDGRALEHANYALERGFDRELRPLERMFFYTPFMHSERIEDQRRMLRLYAPFEAFPETAGAFASAIAHFEIFARFGRFPHRNAILGRANTPAEEDFLRHGGADFGAVPPGQG